LNTKDFDPKTGPFPSKHVQIEKLNEEEVIACTQENLAKLPVHPGQAGVTEDYSQVRIREPHLEKPIRTADQKPANTKITTTPATGESIY
jgi:hypothetical protein